MSRIAYLSMDSLAEFECYDHLTIGPLEALGHEVLEVSWRQNQPWESFDFVIIRSPWDYQDDPVRFMQVLDTIERSPATLLNSLATVKWNINKRYLKDFEAAGVTIVPTRWSTNLQSGDLASAVNAFKTKELIVKPAVSANADDTFRIPAKTIATTERELLPLFANREHLIQPFLGNVLAEGEYSLFYFGGELSHCILKTPKTGDFRVQEEHGGRLQLVTNPEAKLVAAGNAALSVPKQALLYARFDFVRAGEAFLLMEAELIEPSLYFNLDPDSPDRFAATVDQWIRNHPKG